MIYVIEPHPDDAFMSLHAHITGPWQEKEITIVSVTGSMQRLEEAEAYATSVGCGWRPLLYRDSGWGKSEIGPIEDWQLPFNKPENLFLFPLGLRHPDHIRVAELSHALDPTLIAIQWYLDAYYVQADSNPDLAKTIQGTTVVSALWAMESKRFYVSRFPSQSLRMLTIQPNYPPRFELVVK